MNIKRDVLMKSATLDDLTTKIREEAERLGLGEARDRNDHGPVYMSATYDLRIERDAGQWGEYRLMLLHKGQPPASMGDKLRKKFGRD